MKQFVGKILVGKAIILENETTFIGNIQEEGGGSVCLTITGMFDYNKDTTIVILTDLSGISYFYECKVGEAYDSWTLYPVLGQEVQSVMEYIYSSDYTRWMTTE